MKIVEAAYKDPSVDNSLLDGIKWEIHVVNDPTASPNAFVLPGVRSLYSALFYLFVLMMMGLPLF